MDTNRYQRYSEFNIYKLVKHMQQHISILEICKEDKDECIKVYGGKVEMTKDIHFLTL